MKTTLSRIVAPSLFVLLAGLASTALADVWVSSVDRLDRLSPTGAQVVSVKSAFGLPIGGRGDWDTIEIDRRDGSVWVYDRSSALPPPTPPSHYEDVYRLLHVSRAGAPLLQVTVLDGFGLAVDHGRGGIWISRPEGRTDPHVSNHGTAPSELLLLDPSSGAIKARVHGFRPFVDHITIGADGAIWVAHWGGTGGVWTRLTGTLAEIDGYDVSTSETGLHHRDIDFDFSSPFANVVDPSDGTVWLGRRTPPPSGTTLGAAEVLKLSPDGMLLTKFRPRLFADVFRMAVDSRNSSIWLADSDTVQTGEYGANVAHYSSLSQELATTRDWDALYDVTVDMVDRSAWVLIARKLDDTGGGPRSLLKLDAAGKPTGIELAYRSDARIAGSSAMEIGIDIQPWDTKDRIDPNSTGTVTVALFSGPGFDATRVRSDTVRFGTAGAVSRNHWTDDMNGDGRLDLLEQFRTSDTEIKCGDTQAPLTGKTTAGWEIHATGSIRTIGCATH